MCARAFSACAGLSYGAQVHWLCGADDVDASASAPSFLHPGIEF
jgi:hypothetical protein